MLEGTQRKVGTIGTRNTQVTHFSGGWVRVILHKTEIVHTNPQKGIVFLDSGGYRTQLTKRRMNEVAESYGLDFSVHQVKGKWYVITNGIRLDFFDGIQFRVAPQPTKWGECLDLDGDPHEAFEMDRYCGAYLCGACGAHKGLERCYCGWSMSAPGRGAEELVAMGETIDD